MSTRKPLKAVESAIWRRAALILAIGAAVPVPNAGRAQTPARAPVIRNGFGTVTFLRYSPDGRELVRVCESGIVELFDTIHYKRARTFSETVRTAVYSPDGRFIATAEGAGGARIWDSTNPGEAMPFLPPLIATERYLLATPLQVLQPSGRDARAGVSWVEFSPDGKLLITAHGNGHVKAWNPSTWKVESDVELSKGEVGVAVFSPDGKSIVFGDAGGVLYDWNSSRKPELRTMSTAGP